MNAPRTVAGLLAFLGGCETCGSPAEPLISLVVTLDATPDAADYIHASMWNSHDEYVDSMTQPASTLGGASWRHLLGNCDGTPQTSGTFTVYAWLEPSSEIFIEGPPTGAPQGIDMVDVICGDDGCQAAREARITIR
jgi:hypothetical protein